MSVNKVLFRIAVSQIVGSEDPSAQNIRANGAHIREFMRKASNAGARLVQFHEGALSGYPSKRLMSSLGPDKLGESDWSKVAWEVLNEELQSVMALAQTLKLWVVIGSIHKLKPPQRPHNSLYVISDKGAIVMRYDKRLISKTEISYMYTPGQQPVTFKIDGLTFGCVICIEVNYPELFMQYERLGVDCVLFSTYSQDPMFGIEAQGHAASNSYWVTFCPPVQGAHAVPAGIIAPNGSWLQQARSNTPQLVVVNLDPRAPQADEAIHYRRPWRQVARKGAVYKARFVNDAIGDPRLNS